MIKFRGLRYKNLLAVGNQWITIPFADGEKNLFMGPNGSGKSTMIEALFLVLYGKAFRKALKGELVNTINEKNLVVEIWFDIGTNKYRIRRGITPDFCELYINDKLKKRESTVRDYQTFIEKQILKMDEKTFRQIVVLGSSSYVPFMKLNAGNRRVVVEDLLDIGIFSFMLQVVKSKSSEIRADILTIENNMNILVSKIDIFTKQKLMSEGGAQVAIADYETSKANLQTEVDTFMGEIKRLLDKRSDFEFKEHEIIEADEARLQHDRDEMLLEHIIQEHEGNLDYFADDGNLDCPTCSQEFDNKIRKAVLTGLRKTIKSSKLDLKNLVDNRGQYTDLIQRLNDHRVKLEKIDEMTAERKTHIVRLQDQMTNIDEAIQQIMDTANDSEFEIEKDLDEATKDLKTVKKDLRTLNIKLKRLDYIATMLRDGGIKTKIINTYLPVINKLVRKYLDIMEFSADFRFDDTFKETIKVRGRDEFSYGMFSEGEKLRVDLAILFTWRELSRMKNSAACNLIIFDEIGDSSLDKDGFDAFMKVLNADRENQCAFIISHKPDGILGQVNNVYSFEKQQNFTILKEKTTQEDYTSLT